VICYKQRKEANIIDTMELIGEVKGRNVILVDEASNEKRTKTPTTFTK
jgi:phosphoribosylpyrophosphate synthetase